MHRRPIARLVGLALLALVSSPLTLAAQETTPVRRVANIVSVAIEEYKKGIDATGRLISATEYQEAVDFLKDAQSSAQRLPGGPGDQLNRARAILDSIDQAVRAHRPPAVLDALEGRFSDALGSEAQLELPRGQLDVAAGQRLYTANCASCHGTHGMGDGPAGAALNPKPPALASNEVMYTVTPAMIYRKMSVGVSGTAMAAFEAALSSEQRWNIVAYLGSLRSQPRQVAEGEGLYAQSCADCHGMSGSGEGSMARSLSKLPTELRSFPWQAQRSDSQVAAAVRAGMPGTPMPPAGTLTPAQVQSVVAYLRSLPLHERAVAAVAPVTTDTGPARVANTSIALLQQSLTAAREARPGDAGDLASDAYRAFEPLETRARARDPGLVGSMEQRFADFRGAIRANDLRGAERASDAIEANMQRVLDLTRPAGNNSEAFLQSFLIILREGFEAILVIGAVVAFLLKTGHRERLKSIWMGIALALAASAVTAIVLKTVLSAIPASREIIEGLTLLLAVGVLFSVSYWLISRVEAARWQQFIRGMVNNALEHGGGKALAFVAFLAVYREGAETALFYQALFNEGPHLALPIFLGILVGFAALAVIFTLFYRFGVRIPLRPFFSVTSVLLYYMAFVFMGKGIRELQEGNAIPITRIRGFPNVDALGIYNTWQTLLAQVLLLALFVFAVAKTFWPKRSVTLPTVAPEARIADSMSADIAALRDENTRLAERLSALESAANRERAEEGRS